MSSQNLEWKAENISQNLSKFIYLSMHTMPKQWLKLYWKSPQKSILIFVETLKHFSFRATAGTIRSRNFRAYFEGKNVLLRSFNAPINSQFIENVQRKRWTILNIRALHIFAYKLLCLILNLLCSTASKVTLFSMATQQTGPIIRWTNFSKYRVSTG